MKTSSKNYPSRQNRSNPTNKAQFSLFCEIKLTWVISCSCLWKPHAKYPKADMRQSLINSLSFKKIPILSVFCHQVFMGNQSFRYVLFSWEEISEIFHFPSSNSSGDWNSFTVQNRAHLGRLDYTVCSSVLFWTWAVNVYYFLFARGLKI